MEDQTKLYSQKAIAIATFFGGFLAAGILIRRNFVNMEKERLGLNALFIGILTTVLLFIGVLQLPENVIDVIPGFLISAIYTFIVFLIVRYTQGVRLKQHKEENLPFYSAWRAAGVGLLCSILISAALFAYLYEFHIWDYDTYQKEINEFVKNEEDAIQLFRLMGNNDREEVVTFIQKTVLFQKAIIEKNKKIEKVLDELNN